MKTCRFIEDDEIAEAIYECMEILKVKYMPTICQLNKVKEIHNSERVKHGSNLVNLINKRGGLTLWREQLKLEDKKSYERRISQSRNFPHKYITLLAASLDSGISCDRPCKSCEYEAICKAIKEVNGEASS